MVIPELTNTQQGDELPAPAPGTDAADLIYLLNYCRRRGYKLGPTIQIGRIAVMVTDLRQIEEADASPLAGPDDPDMELLRG